MRTATADMGLMTLWNFAVFDFNFDFHFVSQFNYNMWIIIVNTLDKENKCITMIEKGESMNKNFRELRKMLEKEGFILIKDGNHCIFERNSKTICVTKNVRDPKRLFHKALNQADLYSK